MLQKLELEYWLWEQKDLEHNWVWRVIRRSQETSTLFIPVSINYSYLYFISTLKLQLLVTNLRVLKFNFKYKLKFTFMAKLDGIIFLGHSNSVVWIRMPDSSKSVALKSGL